MSEPKRYAWKVNEENDFDLIEHPKGEYVRYEDYARLKAEVERLTAFTTRTIIPNEELKVDLENCRIALRVKYEEVAKFKAEVERLTKAGDKMAHIHRFVGFPSYTFEWEAAKEGKQS
jgi:hypothetical protein